MSKRSTNISDKVKVEPKAGNIDQKKASDMDQKKASERKKSFDDYIRELPAFIGKEIFKFILPNLKFIEFKKGPELKFIFSEDVNYPSRYCQRYEVAFFNGEQIVNKKYYEYLSRISKKNGKHRYYITIVKQIHGKCKLDRCVCRCKFFEECCCYLRRVSHCYNYSSGYYCGNYDRCEWCRSKEDDIICPSCENLMDFENVFYSFYVGKDIDSALIQLLF